ncbi:GDSL lipase-like [Rosa rugosa]|uniref:GDSL lipase-like n=1 Tax=Rosa rugosa TaxID=74645 RepID=UPI002B404B2F|nr:GDSL lipase-like [Rosa rugosa]
MAALKFHILILASWATLLIPCSSHGDSGLQKRHAALYVFGDSLFDPGNNNYISTTNDYKADWSPYGETFFKYPTGRFCDGRLIPDFIAEYAKLPIVPAFYPRIVDYTYGVNFASGGAGSLNETHKGFVIPLNDQLHNFKNMEKHLRHNLGDAKTYTLLSNAVYLISIGGNDYFTPFATNCSFFETDSQEEYVGIVIGNLTNVIKEIYNKGGRKFGFTKLPPLGLVPSQRPGNKGTCVKEVTSLANIHNAALPKHLEKLKSKLQGFKYSIAKLDTYLTERINKPSKYGFKEGMSACCGSGPYGGIYSCGGKRGVAKYQLCANVSEYVFFDSFHPTERIYQQLSELWWNQVPNAKEPYSNLKELFEV